MANELKLITDSGAWSDITDEISSYIFVTMVTTSLVLRNATRHYFDIIMGTMASQITSLTIVYSTVYPGADQRNQQSSASLALVWGIHWSPVNSPHEWPVTRKMGPFDEVIMFGEISSTIKKKGFISKNVFKYHLSINYPPKTGEFLEWSLNGPPVELLLEWWSWWRHAAN